MLIAIDVSHWQQAGIIEKMIKEAGIQGAMIRLGHGLTLDEKARGFVEECERFDIDYGFYWYYENKSSAEWMTQTHMFLMEAGKYNPTLPLAIDYEEDVTFKQANQNTIMCGTMIEESGYYCMVYSNIDFAKNLWNNDVKARFAFWLADWSKGWERIKDTGANVVMVQTTNTYCGMSLDGNEFVDELPALCKKVRNKSQWKALSQLIVKIEDMLELYDDGSYTIEISKAGGLYKLGKE